MNTHASTLITAAIVAVVGAAAFFGGIQYQMRQRPAVGGQFASRMGGPTGSDAMGGQQTGQRGVTGMAPVSGEIIGTDETSITVKMPDGSSKIVILSDQTTVQIASEGAKTDLKTGEKATAFGIQNQDGSITAESVTLGTAMMMRGPGGQTPRF